jgi:hypothetical protein
MAQLKFELKSPFIPLFSKGDFSVQDFQPLFGKEGKGRFLAERRRKLCGESLRQDIK